MPKEQVANAKSFFSEIKNVAVLVLIAAFIFFVYYFFVGSEISGAKFVSQLTNASKVYIIQDLRGVSDDDIRRNIMQCGVDFAGSEGLARLNVPIIAYAVEETNCFGIDGNLTVQECVGAHADGVTFHIVNGEGTKFYDKKAVVGVGANYKLKQCGIKVR